MLHAFFFPQVIPEHDYAKNNQGKNSWFSEAEGGGTIQDQSDFFLLLSSMLLH